LNFSDFLKNIYKSKNGNITTQEEFVKSLFVACAPNAAYADDYYKKLLNGRKPLTNDIREFMISNGIFDNVVPFFEKNISEKRIIDLFEDFDINVNEKKDLSVLAEALSVQFEIYMRYEENEIPTSVQRIYEVLLDQYGNGLIENANEKALFAAKQYFFQAMSALNAIKVNEDILTLQGPFENFFSNIYKSYRAYESNCNLEGRDILRYIRTKILKNNTEIDDFIKMIAEPGALPIELYKELLFTIYDNFTFKDRDLKLSIQLFEKQEKEMIIQEFKNFKFHPVSEIFFTQFIRFKLKGKEKNLIDEAIYICEITDAIFNSIQMNLKTNYDPLDKITDEIKGAFRKLKHTEIQFVVDGVYYPSTGKINFAPSIIPMISIQGKLVETGTQKFKISKNPVLKKINKFAPLDVKFSYLFDFQHFQWKTKGDYGEMMAEFYTFNKDNTYRLFLVPITSKARIYRLVRDVLKLVFVDQMIGFSYTSIMTINYISAENDLNKFLKMTSDERIQIGEDQLVGLAYQNKQVYSKAISKKDSIAGYKPEDTTVDYSIFIPLIKYIEAFEQIFNEKTKKAT